LLDYLRLDDDIPAVYRRMTEHDPRLAKAVRRLHGMRLLRQDPWECLVTFLCSGHNNILRISLMVERMADAYGTKMALQGIGRCAFPSAQRLAGANEADLRRLGLGFRARGVAEAARMVASGGLPIQDMKAWPYGRAKERLLTVRGIGEKIADCVLLFSLDKLEAFPIDRWVRRAAEDWYAPPVRLGPRGKPLKEAPYADLLAWAQQKWEGDAGYANQYLFLGRRAEEREVGQMRRAR
jgi:N-glycosylase/DNA lyase